MNRTDLVLAVLAAGNGSALTPVQAQKLFFLLDQKIPTFIDGPRFNFAPYDYGPFDHEVYRELESLQKKGLVEINQASSGRLNMYRPTETGLELGRELLSAIDRRAADFMTQLSTWVRQQSFADLVSSIYREFPPMKVNSVFRG